MLTVPRSTWELPAEPVTGPAADHGLLSSVTWHYPGTTTSAPSTDAQKVAYLRAEQHSYTTIRGYSLGYGYTIFADGTCWEARGLDYRNAADGSTTWNMHSVAVQFCTATIDTPLTAEQVATAGEFVAWLETQLGRPVAQWGHRDVRSQTWPNIAAPGHQTTACPGDAIYRLIPFALPVPPAPPGDEEDHMTPDCLLTVEWNGGYITFAEWGSSKTWLPTDAAGVQLDVRNQRLGKGHIPTERLQLADATTLDRLRSQPLTGGARLLGGSVYVDEFGIPQV
jgi:hypothetical protein